jgi:histidinol-phosphate aminotransferase
VIDEAYIDFSADAGWLPRLSEYDNLVVLQTLSKAWGLANIRIGMAYSSPDVIEILNRIKPPYNVSGLSQSVAIDAMRNPETMQRHVDRIVTMRGDLEDALLEIEVVKKIYPSEANFLLVRVSDPEEVRAYLRDYGIVVRDRSSMPGCEGCLRITVGTPEQNRRLLEALAAWEVTA